MTSTDLMAKFEYALDDKWGYIWGQAGDMWTEAKQRQKVNYMVSKYGTSWKKNSEAKDDNYYRAALYGDKWIGHRVADCSGLFKWAFGQFKVYIAHGSNTIFRSYTTKTGRLSKGKRLDGATLKPGTAVFTYKESKDNYSHIGLYIGGTKVIEASGTEAGVCVSNISASKWTHWGELKNVDYEINYSDVHDGFPKDTGWRPTIRKGSKGQDVIECQTMLYKLGYDIGVWGIDGDFGSATEKAVKAFQSDHKLTGDGIVGPMTWDALQAAYNAINEHPQEKLYTICIHHLDKTQATALHNNYPGSIITEE